MTTVLTRSRKIGELEGFDIQITKGGKAVKPTKNGVIKNWPHDKATKASRSVKQFRTKFSAVNPGYDCHVLMEDGSIANGNTLLRTVRESYEE